MNNIFSNIWDIIVWVAVFMMLFYAGFVSGIVYENRRLILNDKKMLNIEQGMKENAGKITALESISRGKKK